MIVLDTDVLSEPLRVAPGARVVERMRAQADAAVTAVSVAELLTGAYRRPHGVRREQLLSAIERVLAGPEILAVDASAAREYASMQESRRAEGRPLSIEDGMIVAIARANGAAVATRNTVDFESLGVVLVDPWAE